LPLRKGDSAPIFLAERTRPDYIQKLLVSRGKRRGTSLKTSGRKGCCAVRGGRETNLGLSYRKKKKNTLAAGTV